jgi:hypothetical protein
MKLYDVAYVAVPFVTVEGTFISRRRVEFTPGTVGSGAKLIDVSLNREAPFEQSDTEGVTGRTIAANTSAAIANIL